MPIKASRSPSRPTLDATAAARLEVMNGGDPAKHFIESGRVAIKSGSIGRDQRIDRSHNLRGIGLAPNEYRMVRELVFGQRQVELSGVAAVKLNAARIARDADDLVGRPVRNEFAPIVEFFVVGPSRRLRPMGFWPGQSCLAADSLRMTECSDVRPAIESAAQEQRNAEGLESSLPERRCSGGSTCTFGPGFFPSTETAAVRKLLSSGGRALVIAATPGRAARRVRSSRTRASLRAAVYFGALGKLQIEIDDVFAVVARFHLQRIDGTPNQHASGNHEHQRKRNLRGERKSWMRRLRTGEVLPLTPEESAERELSSAGASPNRMPAIRETART